MNIERIQTFTRGHLSIVKITSTDGAEGFGQISPYSADIAAQVLHQQIAPAALGWDVNDLEGLNTRVIEATYKFPGSYICRALTGVDTAIWDLRGKQAGKSVCELLGGTPRPIKVYGSSMRRDITPEAEAERLAALKEEMGYRAFKIRVGKVTGHDQDQWPGRTEALIPAVRKAVGAGVTILADGNSCYTPKRAIEIGRLLEEYNFGHFEEPCPYWELEWTAEVARTLDIPVAGGEQDYDLNQWKRIAAMPAVDIAQPDVCYIGGLTRALQAAKLAENAGLICVPHSANDSLVLTFTLHMMGAIPNAGPHVEYSIEPSLAGDLYTPYPHVQNGQVMIPDGPGWGVEINPDWLAAAEYQESKI